MAKIILDTNFLLIPAQFRLDIFEKLREFGSEFVVLSPSIGELKKISVNKGKVSQQAKIAIELVKKRNIRVHEAKEKSADDAILKFAVDNGYIVATNDKKLIKRLKMNEIKIIRLRQKKYFILE